MLEYISFVPWLHNFLDTVRWCLSVAGRGKCVSKPGGRGLSPGEARVVSPGHGSQRCDLLISNVPQRWPTLRTGSSSMMASPLAASTKGTRRQTRTQLGFGWSPPTSNRARGCARAGPRERSTPRRRRFATPSTNGGLGRRRPDLTPRQAENSAAPGEGRHQAAPK
jgi:hypothetical protein